MRAPFRHHGLLLTFIAATLSGGQLPAFDVASIKPNTSGNNMIFIDSPGGGRFRASGMTVRGLISNAYQVRDFQIQGGPAWSGADRFDIEAKSDADIPKEQTPLMVQRLLADRFQLRMHRETRELPVYELSVAKGGNKLQAVAAPPGPVPGAAPPPPGPGSPLRDGSMRVDSACWKVEP
jgi:uncharacterized protein (TIGR03435 family)